MKKLTVILAISLLSSGVFAKKSIHKRTTLSTIKNNQVKFDIRKPVSKFFQEHKKGIRAGLAMGSLDMNIRGRTTVQGQPISISSNETHSTNFQFQLGYEKIQTKTIGYSGFVVYQDIRDVKFNDNSNLRNMRIMGNATYGINAQAYTYGGLNYSKYYGSGFIEDALDAGIGYQAGIGLKIHKRAHLELEYLTLLNEGSQKGINFDAQARGMMIRLNTPLFM